MLGGPVPTDCPGSVDVVTGGTGAATPSEVGATEALGRAPLGLLGIVHRLMAVDCLGSGTPWTCHCYAELAPLKLQLEQSLLTNFGVSPPHAGDDGFCFYRKTFGHAGAVGRRRQPPLCTPPVKAAAGATATPKPARGRIAFRQHSAVSESCKLESGCC